MNFLIIISIIVFTLPSSKCATQYAYLKAAHVGSVNPGFQSGSCPVSPTGYKYGWHFVLSGTSTTFLSISCTFAHAGIVTRMVQYPTNKHAYVFTPTGDKILGVSAVVNGTQTEFVLSHVCDPTSTTFVIPSNDSTVSNTSTVNEVSQQTSSNTSTVNEVSQQMSPNTSTTSEVSQPESSNAGTMSEVSQPESSNIGTTNGVSQQDSSDIGTTSEVFQPESSNAGTMSEVSQPESSNIGTTSEVSQQESSNDGKVSEESMSSKSQQIDTISGSDSKATVSTLIISTESAQSTVSDEPKQSQPKAILEPPQEEPILISGAKTEESQIVTNLHSKTTEEVVPYHRESVLSTASSGSDRIPNDAGADGDDKVADSTSTVRNSITKSQTILPSQEQEDASGSNSENLSLEESSESESESFDDVSIETNFSENMIEDQDSEEFIGFLVNLLTKSTYQRFWPTRQKAECVCSSQNMFVEYIYEHDIYNQVFNSSLQDLTSAVVQRLRSDITDWTVQEIYKHNLASDIPSPVRLLKIIDVTKEYNNNPTVRYYLSIVIRRPQIPIIQRILTSIFDKLQRKYFAESSQEIFWSTMVSLPM